MTKEIIIIADYSEDELLTIAELSEALQISPEFVQELIELDIIHPQYNAISEFVFNSREQQRIHKARRLQKDLEMNLAGVAMVLELLDEMEKLRSQLIFLEKHALHEDK